MVNKNRRNYYRILRVQPDASTAVIRNNYRTLLQKLRLHPDLGGDDWNASLLNIAWNTLRHPQRRAEYDRSLLQQHPVEQLSRGHLGREGVQQRPSSPRTRPGNQRNYYRILHIQSDSPTAIVNSSYRTLLNRKKPDAPPELLQEAHQVLANPLKRSLYDRLLQQHDHFDAVDILKRTFQQPDRQPSAPKPQHPPPEPATKATRPAKGYSPLITHYCAFCKTPHNHSAEFIPDSQCQECESPLATPSVALTGGLRREVERIHQQGPVIWWADWPAERQSAELVDVSPTGIRLILDTILDTGRVLKINAEEFKAVGEVSHCQPHANHYQAGIRFVAIRFYRQKGTFIQASI